jgi:hypothetical protein
VKVILNTMKNDVQFGGVLIELALILPVMLVFFFISYEMARILTEYKVVVAQAQIGARYLSTKLPGNGPHINEAKCLVRTGSLDCSSQPILPGFYDGGADVQVNDAYYNLTGTQKSQPTSSGSGSVRINLVTVTITGYRYNLTIPDLLRGYGDQGGFILPATVDFGKISATMRQTN